MTEMWRVSLLASSCSLLVVATALLVLLEAEVAEANESFAVGRTSFGDATATFYGGSDAAGTAGGFCGYENPFTRGYGVTTVALSDSLLSNGLNCGACYEVKCKWEASDYTKKYCYQGMTTVVSATNLSPPGLNGEHHFDLTYPMFVKISNPESGRIPIQYRRVPCRKEGGIRFSMVGNPFWNLVLVYNVGGWGNVHSLYVRGSRTDWYYMNRNWGQNWQCSVNLTGQNLSFRVVLGNGQTMVFNNVADSDWKHGQTYEASSNFW
ncbi:hypothetical protein Mapa_017295 [Marchantia paleacea]|nr:hypothetical protein Mapa_017295 [Marchantia paleacea]